LEYQKLDTSKKMASIKTCLSGQEIRFDKKGKRCGFGKVKEKQPKNSRTKGGEKRGM